jgi:hypothetical protein
MDKKVILSLCRFAMPKLYKKGTFGHFLGTISAEAASSRKTFGATKHGPNTKSPTHQEVEVGCKATKQK